MGWTRRLSGLVTGLLLALPVMAVSPQLTLESATVRLYISDDLTGTAVLALQHIRERFQRTLIGACDDATATTVVEESVYRFLQHPLFVANDNIGRAEFNEPLQTVVAVDDPTIEVVQV